jgi:hypothetical protein
MRVAIVINSPEKDDLNLFERPESNFFFHAHAIHVNLEQESHVAVDTSRGT